jgi:cytoskeleton protein RodZ
MTSAGTGPSEASAVAPRAGGDLRAARERVGWSVEQLAAALRIRPQYLEALEAGRVEELPGHAYALGFLRAYASTLGLDANEVLRRFKAEAASVDRKPELIFPLPVPERKLPAGAAALVGVVLAIAAYAGWYELSGEGRLPAETSTRIPERLASLAEQASQPAKVAQTLPASAEPPPAEPASVQPADTLPGPAISPSSAAAAAVAPAASPASGTAEQSRILLRASADAWVQVRDRTGTVLLTRILHAGETWEVPPRPNLVLTTGNAGGTELVVDGAAVPSLGGNGAVRRDVPLDPDLLKDGKLAALGSRPNPQ